MAASRIVRYALAGLGHIAQVAVIPAFAHARRNSTLVAVVSGNRTKRREIAKRYRLEHAFSYDEYAEGLEFRLTVDGKSTRKKIGKRDQFAPELLYFSDCIIKDRAPEPPGEEGLQDVKIVQALYESSRIGRPVKIGASKKEERPTGHQRITRPGIRKPTLVKVQSASHD